MFSLGFFRKTLGPAIAFLILVTFNNKTNGDTLMKKSLNLILAAMISLAGMQSALAGESVVSSLNYLQTPAELSDYSGECQAAKDYINGPHTSAEILGWHQVCAATFGKGYRAVVVTAAETCDLPFENVEQGIWYYNLSFTISCVKKNFL